MEILSYHVRDFRFIVAHCWFYRLCVHTEDESYEEQFEERTL